MRFFVKVLLFSIFLNPFVYGNEGGAKEAAPAAAGEAAKGGAEAADKGMPPWFETEARIQELTSKIAAKEQTLNTLLAEKNKLPEDSPLVKNLVDTIVKEHKELTAMVSDYDKKRNFLKYRFPERGLKGERTYDRIEVKSVEEMEKQMGVEGRLSRNVSKMRKQFGVAEKNQKVPMAPKKTEPTAADPHRGTPGSIEEANSVLIRK